MEFAHRGPLGTSSVPEQEGPTGGPGWIVACWNLGDALGLLREATSFSSHLKSDVWGPKADRCCSPALLSVLCHLARFPRPASNQLPGHGHGSRFVMEINDVRASKRDPWCSSADAFQSTACGSASGHATQQSTVRADSLGVGREGAQCGHGRRDESAA